MKITNGFDIENQTENTSLTNNQTSSWFGRKVCCCANGQCLGLWTSFALVVGGVASMGVALSQNLDHGTENLPLYISGGIEMTLGLGGLYFLGIVLRTSFTRPDPLKFSDRFL